MNCNPTHNTLIYAQNLPRENATFRVIDPDRSNTVNEKASRSPPAYEDAGTSTTNGLRTERLLVHYQRRF